MSKNQIATASLLVAGTAIGAGILALPVSTGPGGFWPSMMIYFVCWIYSLATGLLLLEACLWLPKDSNIISLSLHLLGKRGKVASWVLYIFLFDFLTVAYTAAGGSLIEALSHGFLTDKLSIVVFVLLFSPVVYMGTKAVDRWNFVLMAGLVITFFIFLFVGFDKVTVTNLSHADWSLSILALPVVFTSFSYQGIVPSMRDYFHGNSKAVRKVLIIGSTIPFFIYVIWQILIMGIIPVEGLERANELGQTAVAPLRGLSGFQSVYAAGQALAFFTLTTSFLGVTLGLFDFFSDGLKLPKRGKNKALLYLIVYLPPTIIALLNPNIFLRALSYAGGIGCALLLGLIPVMMVWSGRYKKKLGGRPQLAGGKTLLLLIGAFIFFELGVEIINELL